MNLYDLFKLDEGYRVLPNYDKERYTERPGLEGPMRARNGKVVYYDPREGSYYDPDTDMYIDNKTWDMMNENDEDVVATTAKAKRMLQMLRKQNPGAKNDIEALLLAFEKGQKQDRSDISTLYGQNQEEEMDIAKLERALEKLKSRAGLDEADGNKDKAMAAAMAKIQDQFKDLPKYTPQSAEERATAHKEREERAMAKAKENADMLLKLAKDHGEEIEAKEVGYFAKGIADGKRDYRDPKASDAYGPNVYAYDAGVRVGEKLGQSVNEDYYDTDEQRELARLGRIIMDMGAKRDDDVGVAMGAVGMELTKYGTPQGVSSIQKLEKVTGQPESVIMKMMALAQKVQGDVAVGDNVPDEDELEEADFDTNFKKRVGYTVKGGAASNMMKQQAAQAQQMNRELDPGAAEKGLGIGVLDTAKARKKAAKKGVRAPGSLRSSPNTRNPERLPEAESPMVTATIPNNLRDSAMKLKRLAKENGVEYARQGRTVTLTGDKTNVRRIFYKMAYDPANHPKMTPVNEAPGGRRGGAMAMRGNRFAAAKDTDLKGRRYPGYTRLQYVGKTNAPGGEVETYTADNQGKRVTINIQNSKIIDQAVNEALEHDIKIGDTVETLKMGQMQGTVTGFSTKSGSTKVMFKHKSGKVYATPASNLKVIDTAKKTEGSSSLNELDLYGAYEDYVRMPDGSYLKIKYRSSGEPGTQWSKQSFIGKPEPVDPATVQRLQLDKRTSNYKGLDPKIGNLGGGSGFGRESGSKTPFAPRDIGVIDYEKTQPAIKKALTQYLAQDVNEAKKKPVPTDPSKWSYYKSQAKKKFDVYPSAYANAWAAKQYKAAGGGWRMGKPKK